MKDRLSKDIYKHPALVPPMPWLDHEPPKKPTLKGAIPRDEGVAVGIIDNRENDSAYYAIYRVNGKSEVNIENPKKFTYYCKKDKAWRNLCR
ncbi:hypothetical protein ACT7CY_24075 [Bacillus pacificus]